MIPFTFKVSIKRNSVHFFPKGDQYPFFLVSNIDNQYFLVEAAIQKTFDRLLTLQQQIKKRSLNEQRVDNLLVEINNYFIGTDAA